MKKQGEQKLYVNDNAKEMFIKALERVEEQNSKGYKLTDCDKNSWWEDFKTYTSEQNLANSAKTCKVEPKFKVGDWGVFDNKHQSIYQVEKIEGGYYILRHTYGGTLRVCVLHDESLRLWTIQDAKEGDVLDANGAPFIYKKHDKDCVYFYCGVNLAGEFIEANGIDTWNNNYKVYPATKEQRDLLFQKMKESGYKWDADKKELIKL